MSEDEVRRRILILLLRFCQKQLILIRLLTCSLTIEWQ